MKTRPYLVTLSRVNLSRRPLCFRSTRLWTINVLVCAAWEYDGDGPGYDYVIKNRRVISMETPGYGLLAQRLSQAARNRLDDLLDDEGPIEAATWDALDNRADYLGDLPAKLAAAEFSTTG